VLSFVTSGTGTVRSLPRRVSSGRVVVVVVTLGVQERTRKTTSRPSPSKGRRLHSQAFAELAACRATPTACRPAAALATTKVGRPVGFVQAADQFQAAFFEHA
jgi:hypothetical protein